MRTTTKLFLGRAAHVALFVGAIISGSFPFAGAVALSYAIMRHLTKTTFISAQNEITTRTVNRQPATRAARASPSDGLSTPKP